MPLQLGGPETLRPKVFTWDENNYLEYQEVLAEVEKAKKLGFRIAGKESGEIKMLPPKRDLNIGCFRILSENGDDRVIWDRRNKNQVKEAFKKFKELMKKGYTAYAATVSGQRGHKITEFDPGLEEIILGGKEMILVPKTMPG